MKSTSKKITLGLILIVLLFSTPISSSGIKKVEAVTIEADISIPSLTTAFKSTLSLIENTITAAAVEALALKELSLDTIAWNIGKQTLQQLTGDFLKWLGGGENGDIPFATNLGDEYLDAAAGAGGGGIFGSTLNGLCSEEETYQVRVEVYEWYIENFQKTEAFSCVDEELEQEKVVSPSLAILRSYTSCDGDDICAGFKGIKEVNKAIADAQFIRAQELNIGRGFKAQKVCRPITDSAGNTTQKCDIVSPLSLRADAASSYLVDLPLQQLINMDELNEVISGFAANLTNQAISSITGSLGLAGNNPYSAANNIFGPNGNLSYADALAQDDITQYQTATTNPIEKSLKAEQDYLALVTDILNQVVGDEIEDNSIHGLEEELERNREEFPSCFEMGLTEELESDKQLYTPEKISTEVTIQFLTELNRRYKETTDANVRNAIYGVYTEQADTTGGYRNESQNQELKISYIDYEFAEMVDKFKYDMAVERYNCGGDFNYEGPLEEEDDTDDEDAV